jgi:hypothetical protein
MTTTFHRCRVCGAWLSLKTGFTRHIDGVYTCPDAKCWPPRISAPTWPDAEEAFEC